MVRSIVDTRTPANFDEDGNHDSEILLSRTVYHDLLSKLYADGMYGSKDMLHSYLNKKSQ